MICTPITERNSHDFLAALDEAAAVAEAVELRLDYLNQEDLVEVLAALPARIASSERTFIMTFRPREQGGERDLLLHDRVAFWTSLSSDIVAGIAFADFELDLVDRFAAEGSPIPWDKVIASYHNFNETPTDLGRIVERLKRTPARVIKVATLARHQTDCLRIFNAIDQSGTRPVIAIGMGMPGISTRVLSVSRGAMLTFGSLRAGAESASGQPTVADLSDLYHIKTLTRESEVYGVIGYPIGHSLSPRIHNSAMKEAGRDAVYLPLEVEADLESFIRDMVHPRTRRISWKMRGLSVTIPHKLEIMKFLDEVDPLARKVGAVNTVVVRDDRLVGYNTDVAGAMKPLDEVFNVRGARVAVLGCGGAARAVCQGLASRGAVIRLYSRDVAKCRALADELQIPAAPLFTFTGMADVVVNCTPLGMEGHSQDKSPVPQWSLQGVKLIYDLVYKPEETKLLRLGREAGCRTLGGMAMLMAQAAEQRSLWT
jgi:3-dehydroquinate dehydratase / shikimate dehydrogenase